jgi:hypothetical protein
MRIQRDRWIFSSDPFGCLNELYLLSQLYKAAELEVLLCVGRSPTHNNTSSSGLSICA